MDWAQIIRDLLDNGMRPSVIARGAGLKPPSISDILLHRQKTVRWEVGNALLTMHLQHCKKAN